MSDVDELVTLASLAGIERVYALGEVPTSPGYPYVVIGLDTGTPGIRRAGGGATKKNRRATVQVFSRSDGSVYDLAALADEAFEDKVLSTVTGRPFSMREAQTPLLRDPDDNGVLYVLHTYKLLEA